MSRFVLDTLVILLLLLVGISILGEDESITNQEVSINQVIQDFENDVTDGNVVSDGYGVVDEKSYSTNRLSSITSTIGGFIVDGASFALDLVQKVVKSVVG